jgi:hypothetical protein
MASRRVQSTHSSSSDQTPRLYSNIISNDVIGLHFHCHEPEDPSFYPLPDLPPLYIPKRKVYRGSTDGKAAKGVLKSSLVQLPNTSDYIVMSVDPGTSSMAVRVSHRVNGNTEEVYVWETKDFRTDSYMLSSMQEYIGDLLDTYRPGLVVVELQLSRFGLEYSQHLILNEAIARKITSVLIQPATRYSCFGISVRDKERERKIEDIGISLLDQGGINCLTTVRGIKSANGTRVSANKRMNDMLTTVTLEVAVEGILVEAIRQRED